MKICISCQKDVAGMRAVKVKEDRIIKLIRRIKQLFRIAAGNELYVCEDDISKHQERRKAFEKSMLFFGILAAIAVLLFLSSIVLSGNFSPFAILSAFLVGGFILMFALIFKYAPAMEGTSASLVPGSPRAQEKKESKTGKKAGKKENKKKK